MRHGSRVASRMLRAVGCGCALWIAVYHGFGYPDSLSCRFFVGAASSRERGGMQERFLDIECWMSGEPDTIHYPVSSIRHPPLSREFQT